MTKDEWRDRLLVNLAQNQINILKQMYFEERIEARVMPLEFSKRAEDDAERLFERAVDVAALLAFFEKGEGEEAHIEVVKPRIRAALRERMDLMLNEAEQVANTAESLEELAKKL
jgi:PIN domain nuclease of toxin-antitoxin system